MKKIAVIGAGTMGNGIVHVFAQNGFDVQVIDVNREQLEKAILTIQKNFDRQIAKGVFTEEEKNKAISRITAHQEMAKGLREASLVVEAATENTSLKLKIFKELDELAPADCILATNTSSISISKIAAATKRQGKVIGMHFMNPVPVMKLVEVINGYGTSPETTAAIVDLTRKINKVPCVVNDYPGFRCR